MDGEAHISFRAVVAEQDARMLFKWLGDPDVHRWYTAGEHSLANYAERFAPDEAIRKLICLIDGQPIGYLQAYWLRDEPAYAAQTGLGPDVVGIDMFIGEAAYRNRGWGARVLRSALAQIVFGEVAAETACINPDPANVRAVRCYERVGFLGDRVVWIDGDTPENIGYERIMTLTREAFEQMT